jgi:sugar phosphate isomerase/epimerase
MKLGVIVSLSHGPEEAIRRVHEVDMPTCQVTCWAAEWLTPEVAERLRMSADAQDVEITTVWTGTPGPAVWDFVDGPATIGLLPREWRARRVEVLKQGADFAHTLGVSSITTHCGFIPENPGDPEYAGVVEAVRDVAAHCKELGLEFWFETGQETPTTLLRTMQDVGTGNLGINLDPANLLMYGKANPLDALDLLGPYVRGVHAKDGEYPTNPRLLGVEKPLGEGRVNFPALLTGLKKQAYAGALTIEREISGPRQIEDIRRGKAYLEGLIAAL